MDWRSVGLCVGSALAVLWLGCAEQHARQADATGLAVCVSCHGDGISPAPPVDNSGSSDATRRGVGAHRAHLGDGVIGANVPCEDCHVVPATPEDAGHMGPPPAKMRFLGIAVEGGATPEVQEPSSGKYDPTAAITCKNVYCHGATLGGGQATEPVWNRPGEWTPKCDSCHGAPPPPPHPAFGRCSVCHADVVGPDDFTIRDRSLHVDGKIEVSVPATCTICHGSDKTPAPPPDVKGDTARSARGVGAHETHLFATNQMSPPVDCSTCHTVPGSVTAPGHLDPEPGKKVLLTGLATTGGTTPAYDAGTGTCSGAYCHGATLPGGTLTTPSWTDTSGAPGQCGACHAVPPPSPHPAKGDCVECHAATAGPGGTIAHPEHHADGHLDVTFAAGCTNCHGAGDDPAPPPDTGGGTDTTRPGVGAHQNHLHAKAGISGAVACTACHVVPASADAPGHMDATPQSVVAFSGLALTDGAKPAWDPSGPSCANTYCHGGTMATAGGANRTPVWNQVDGTQETCGSCHGYPPPAPHPQDPACGTCHEDATADGKIKTPSEHIDGTLQVAALACNTCHGSATDNAPPVDTSGKSATTEMTVGAHQPHVLASSGLSSALQCNQCHVVPTAVGDPGHLDGAPGGDVTFGSLSKTGGLSPAWSSSSGACTNTYCHGASLTAAGGSNKAPVWNQVDGSQEACGTCHADSTAGMSRPHPAGAAGSTCATCHGATMASQSAFKDPSLHIDGKVEIAAASGSLACNGVCHGTTGGTSPANRAPPVDTQNQSATSYKSVGNHQNHLLAASGISSAIACENCHAVPSAVPDPATPSHLNMAVDVTFAVGQLARKVAGAQYNAAGPTCTNIYCHGGWPGSGAGTSSWSWTDTTSLTSCTPQCHAMPPSTGQHHNENHQGFACGTCHSTVANTTTPNGVTAAGKANHINGNPDVSLANGGSFNAASRECTPACHDTEDWGPRVLPQ